MSQSRIPSLGLAAQAVRDSLGLVRPILVMAGPSLIALHVFNAVASQYFSFAADFVRSRGQEDMLLLVLTAGLEMVFGLVWGAVWSVRLVDAGEATYRNRKPAPLAHLIGRFLNPLMIEALRATAALLLRLPLLILPALIEYIRLSLIPFVVLIHAGYHKGQVDALNASRSLTRGHWWLLGSTIVVSQALPFMITTALEKADAPWFWQNPIGFLLSTSTTFVISFVLSIFLFSLARLLIIHQGWLTDLWPEDKPTGETRGIAKQAEQAELAEKAEQ